MRMKRLICGLVLLVLAGCGTPLEQCERAAAADLRRLENERVERQQNLARGYALEARLVPGFGGLFCDDLLTRCDRFGDFWDTVRVPINPRIEARRIAQLDDLIAEERRLAARAQAQCRVQFPQG